MKTLFIFYPLFFVFLTSSSFLSAQDTVCQAEYTIYRLPKPKEWSRSSFKSTKIVSSPKLSSEIQQGSTLFFKEGEIDFGNIRLEISETGLQQKFLPSSAFSEQKYKLENLSSPRVLSHIGQTAELRIAKTEAFQYMEPLPNAGEFRLQTVTLESGIMLEQKVDVEGGGGVFWFKLNPLKLHISWVVGRESIPGVQLEVGKPLVKKIQTEISAEIFPGHYNTILWQSEETALLIMLRLLPKDVTEEESKNIQDKTSPEEKETPK